MTEDQKKKFAQEKQRLLQNNSLILATVNTEGHPLASSTPFVTKGENFYIFISNKLSPHTQNLLGCSTANILLVEDESLCRNNFARARMNLNVDAQTVSRDSEEFLEIIDLIQEKHGSTVELLKGMADFIMFRLVPAEARLVLGFGQAFAFESGKDQEATHITE